MLLAAVAITVLASAGNNIGKALQKRGTQGLPAFELEGKVLRQYAACGTYMAGMALDLAGALLMIAAFARAPVSVVQPVASAGLAVLAVFSHVFLKERLQRAEWAAVAVASCGTIGLGLTAEEGDGGAVNRRQALLTVGGALLGVGAMAVRNLRKPRGVPVGGAGTNAAALVGLQAGAAFGMSAACCRTGFMLAGTHFLAAPMGLAASVGLTSLGFALQTRGLKDGNTVVVCTCAAVAAMITGVVVGLVGLGEHLPTHTRGRVAQFASWAAILMGVAVLSGAGAHVQVPKRVWAWLPPWLSLRLRKLLQGPPMLPTKSADAPLSGGGKPQLPRMLSLTQYQERLRKVEHAM